MDLRAEPLITALEGKVARAWGPEIRLPVEVFRLVLESRSLACIAILFGNLTGVKGTGTLFAILESAAAERLNYFTFRLSTPPEIQRRPDVTLWYSYPQHVDQCVRNPHFEGFSKLNLFEMGANIRRLRENVEISPHDVPKRGKSFLPGWPATICPCWAMSLYGWSSWALTSAGQQGSRRRCVNSLGTANGERILEAVNLRGIYRACATFIARCFKICIPACPLFGAAAPRRLTSS